MSNTEPEHWASHYPALIATIADHDERVTPDDVAIQLAVIAGDYNGSSDDDVLTTYLNEHLLTPPPPADPFA